MPKSQFPDAAFGELLMALRRLDSPRIDPKHPAMRQIEGLWQAVGPTTDLSHDVVEWMAEAFLGVLEPLAALMLECRTKNRVPSDVHIAAIAAAGDALRQRFSKAGKRRLVVGLFERYPAHSLKIEEYAKWVGLSLNHALASEPTHDRLERIKTALGAMADVRGRGNKKDMSKWQAMACVLNAYGDPITAASLRRELSKKPAARRSHLLKKGGI